MPSITDITATAIEGVTSAAINYTVASAITPFVGPVGAAIAPTLFFSTAAQTIATSATASLITNGIITCIKAAANNQPAIDPQNTEKPLNEEFDDADVPLTTVP